MKPMLPTLADASGSFATTRWSLILQSSAAQAPVEKARAALSELCHIYWKPVFYFILQRGRTVEDAQDLTQEFFMMVLEGDFLQQASRERGRFRSMIWQALENFLVDATRRGQAKKRGGHLLHIPLHEWNEEAVSTMRSLHRLTMSRPESKQFDLRWAAALSERARKRLREECVENGRERIFSELSPFLAHEAGEGGYEPAGAVLGLRQETVRVMVSRLRTRYRALLREEVAGTVAQPAEIKAELSYLFSLLATGEESKP